MFSKAKKSVIMNSKSDPYSTVFFIYKNIEMIIYQINLNKPELII
jgi:hypothetical protein